MRFETGEWKSQWPLRPRVRSSLCIQERNYILKVCNLSWLWKPVKYWYEKPRSLDQAFLKALIAGILGNWFSCLTGYQNVTDGRTDRIVTTALWSALLCSAYAREIRHVVKARSGNLVTSESWGRSPTVYNSGARTPIFHKSYAHTIVEFFLASHRFIALPFV